MGLQNGPPVLRQEDADAGAAQSPAPLSTAPSATSATAGRFRSSIALRLLGYVLLLSSLITLALTLLHLYLDYRHDVLAIESRLDEIERSYLDSLSHSLWRLDKAQLALQLMGILHLPDIGMVEIRDSTLGADFLTLSVGTSASGPTIVREIPVNYSGNGNVLPIGVLYVEATLAEVYRNLLNRALIILAGQGAKTFIVSLFVIYAVHHLLTRHLAVIADSIRRYDVHTAPLSLSLPRKAPKNPDELDHMVGAFKDMCISLHRAYDEQREANAALEIEIATRRRAEEAARESEQRFRDYAETASDWFWESGPDHRFAYFSNRADDFAPLPNGNIGRTRAELAADVADEPEKWRRHAKVLDAHLPFRDFVYRRNHPDGSIHHVSSSGKPRFESSGRFVGYRGVGCDVTETVKAAEALQAAREQELRLLLERKEVEAEKHEFLQHLVTAMEEERMRIARELHDQIGQDLTGLSLGLKSLEAPLRSAGEQNTLQWLRELTRTMASNLHKIAWELRPVALENLGLVGVIESYVGEWSDRFDIRVDFHADGLHGRRLQRDVEAVAHRVVQEAMTNILKHASATAVSVILRCRENLLQIIVEDNGCGFDPDDPGGKRRLGLAGMHERLALVDGTLTVDSSAGSGAALYFRIPLAQASPATATDA